MTRREKTERKLKQRERMLKTYGLRGGTLYKRHREKIENSLGYMRDGNVTHFVQVGFGKKTRDRNRYGKVLSLHIRERRQMLRENDYVQDIQSYKE